MEDNFIGYKIKLYPTSEQEQKFKEYFGASRFVYNLCIDLENEKQMRCNNNEDKYNYLSFVDLNNILLELKKKDKYVWLNIFNSASLSIIIKDVNNAYSKFFKGFCLHPKYKTKKFRHQMFPVRPGRLSINKDTVRLPSIGIVSCDNHNHKEIIGNGNINATKQIYKHYSDSRVIFDGCDYWLTFELEINHEDNIEANSCKRFLKNEVWQHKPDTEPIGIDLGCKQKNWIVDSKGNRIDRPDTSKEEKRVKKYKRKFHHKLKVNDEKGKRANSTLVTEKYPMLKEVERINYTKNEEKILKKLNKAYRRIANKKKAVIHDYACSIIAEKPSSIIMEDLDINDMLLNNNIPNIYRKRHNKKIHDSMLYTVRTIIEQKAKANNIPFILADKEYPSSQLCSKCGYRQKIGTKSIYKCPCCGNEIDRDLNAAINLSNLGYPDFYYNYA